MGIFDHWGKPKPFSSDCLVAENKKKALQMLQFSELSLREIKQFDVFINDFTPLPLNGVSSRFFFLKLINK